MPDGDLITAATDSHEVVGKVTAAFGMNEPKWIGHDKEWIFFGYDWPNG